MIGFRHFYRRGLQRRIFVWFGISIAVTAMVVMRFVGIPSPVTQMDRARQFLAGQFAAKWDDPEARRELARDLARDLGITVDFFDAAHVPLADPQMCRGRRLENAVLRDGRVLGYIKLCEDAHRHRFAWVPLLIAVVMLWGASGAISRRLARPLVELSRVARDIGEGQLKSRVRLPRRTTAEFALLGDVLNEMASRIEKQLADQRALLATVSHEIRTPLARMRLLIELAREKSAAQGAASPAALGQIEREILDIDTLVSDLLAGSRLDFGALTRTAMDARKVAADALERADVDAGRLAAPLSGDTTLFGDATLIARAVSNLLENAKRHGGGVEVLRVEATPTTVSFVVEDLGCGFEPGEEQRAFEPFYRRPSRPEADEPLVGSLGLGLALVRRIAEAHQGRAFAKNRTGRGAQVGIELSRWTAPARA